MRFGEEDTKIINFANSLNKTLITMLFQDKISSNILVGILQQQIYNIHRTMEQHPELVKDITEKYFPEDKKNG